MQINLSTTSQSVSGLSPLFANNVGADDSVVFSSGLFHFGASRSVFDGRIALSKPFYYNPSAGNLLLDIRNLQGNPPPYQSIPVLDYTTESSLSGVYATNVAASAGSGFVGGLVTEFVIAPPPALFLQEATNSVIIAWPTEPKVFVLQTTTNLNAANWQRITNGINGNALYQTLILPRDSLDSAQFFRLVWPEGPSGVK
jgi:hypothetical protein